MKKDRRRIEAVLFDLDDTLIDWSNLSVTFDQFYSLRVHRLYVYLKGLGYQLPEESDFLDLQREAIIDTWEEAKANWTIKSFGTIICQLLESLGLDTSELEGDELLGIIGWAPWPGVNPFPDTIDVLEILRQRNYKIGLLTNSFLPMWMRDKELEAYNLLHYFDARLTAADIGFVKPHPDIYHALLDRLEVSPKQAVFVGDRPKNDIAGANAVGLHSVLMDPPHLDYELDGVVPDYTISSLSELLPILDKLEHT
jgi:HAD superfamily hydrolase (TIGR01509 family)